MRGIGTDRAGVAPAFEEEDAAEDGLPATERRPECERKESGAFGDIFPGSLVRPALCSAGSFALIASAKARDMESVSCVGGPDC